MVKHNHVIFRELNSDDVHHMCNTSRVTTHDDPGACC